MITGILEVGKSYYLTNGERVTVLRKVNNPDYPFIVQTSHGEQQYTADGQFQVFEDSPMDIVSETPPLPKLPPKQTEVKVCIAKYCSAQADLAAGSELCPRCRNAVVLGKNLPGPQALPPVAPLEPQVVTLTGEGWEVTLRKITSSN